MASAFTHAWVGAALAAVAPRALHEKKFVALLCAVSVAPDLDVIAFALGIPYGSPMGHRGLTHSIPFAVSLSLVVWILGHRRFGGGVELPSVRMQLWLVGLTFTAIASHGVLDALTDGGLGVGFWIPFDDARHFFPWRPIPVSPIGIEAFVSSRGLDILLAEIRWIGAPVTVMAGAVLYLRRRFAASEGDER